MQSSQKTCLHFNILGEEKTLKQTEQEMSDESTLPLLTYKEKLLQQALGSEFIIYKFLSF